MLRRTFIRLVAVFIGLLVPIAAFAATGTIDPANAHSRLCQNSDCSQYSIVNWHPTNSTVVVSDTGLTGYIWSADLGWINLSPTNGGVHNTTGGILSGYAWGEVGSWVNFFPTHGGVKIDPDTGQFSGWAWVSNAGWMLFDCTKADACVITTWRGTDTTTTTGGGTTGGGGGDGTGTDTGGDTGTTTTGTDTGTTGTDTGGNTGTDTGGSSTGTTGGSTGGSSSSGGGSTSGGGGGVSIATSPVQVSIPVPNPITTIHPVVPALPAIVQSARNVALSPVGVAVTKSAAVVGVVGSTVVSVTAGVLLNPVSLYDFLLIPIRLWSLLLGAVGLAKRKKPWGTVYDAVTKQPLDPAYVVLRSSEGEDIATAITDLDGRYGFVVPAPGNYTLVASKTNYTFPSQKLVGHDHDELYRDLYFGEHFVIAKAGEVITRNIPMDPVKFDWNEFAKRDQHLLRFYSRREKILIRFSNVFFWLGFLVAAATVLLSMTKYNIIVFCLYVVLFFVRRYGLKTRPYGDVTTVGGNPIPFAIIRITQASTGVEVMHRVADQFGRYYALLANGDYTVRIDQKLPDATYKTIATGLGAKVTKGYLSEKFIIASAPVSIPPQPPITPPIPPTPTIPTPAPQPAPVPVAVPPTPEKAIEASRPVASDPDYSE